MKKHILFPFALLALSLPCISCGNSVQSSSSVQEGSIILNASSKSLLIGETFKLEISYSDVAERSDPIYVATGDAVSVSTDGLVSAIGVGTGTVVVTMGGASATCSFDVSFGGQIPVIGLEGITNDSLTVSMYSSFLLSPYVSFNGSRNEFSPTYSVADATIGSVEDGVFTPAQVGSTVIEIGGTYYGEELHPYYLNVNVIEDVLFTVKEVGGVRTFDNIDLYTASAFRGNTYIHSLNLEFGVTVSGVDHSSELEISLENASGAVNYDEANKTLSGVATGKSNFVLRYGDYEKSIPISVNYIHSTYEGGIFTIDASEGVFPTEEIFAEFDASDRTIVKATSEDGKTEYEVKDGKVYGLKSHNLANQTAILYNRSVGLAVDFSAYAKIIKEASDLNAFIALNGVGDVDDIRNYEDDGYYLLANDIDCAGITYTDQIRILGVGFGSFSGANQGFTGTFDGQGHTIKNMKTPQGGLFLLLGNDAIVKDVCFKDVVLDFSRDTDKFTLCTYGYACTVSNVAINSSSDIKSVNSALVAAEFRADAKLNHCLFRYEGDVTPTHSFGSFSHMTESVPTSSAFLADSYVVSKTPMTVSKLYYTDSRVYDEYASLERRVYPNVKHYLDDAEMAAASETYDSFSDDLWSKEGGILSWKGVSSL